MASSSKKTRGRQKIELKKIEDLDIRMITFSKRRSGIYKKASELIAMCGVEVGVIVFSPTDKPHSFGHPSVQAIINRFFNRDVPPPSNDMLQPLIAANERMRMERYTNFFNKLVTRLDESKEEEKDLSRITRATREGTSLNRNPGWWEKPLEELSLLSFNELKEEASFLESLHSSLCNYLNHPVDLADLGLADPVANPMAEGDQTGEAEAGSGPSEGAHD